jgi:hypothetical protein
MLLNHWQVLGRSIPFIAMENARDRDRINIVRQTVRMLATDYNKILLSLKAKWERRLFVDKIKSLDRKISPAVTKMNWGTKVLQIDASTLSIAHLLWNELKFSDQSDFVLFTGHNISFLS